MNHRMEESVTVQRDMSQGGQIEGIVISVEMIKQWEEYRAQKEKNNRGPSQ